MRIRILAISVLLLLAGCYNPKSPDEVADTLTHRYGDRPINEFFVDHGLSAGEFRDSDGTRVYRWVSTARHAMPPASDYTSSYGDYQLLDTYNGITETSYCELRIYTDEQDTIRKFAVAVDSIGRSSASRCSEIFSNP